jgi:hypothetical protein
MNNDIIKMAREAGLERVVEYCPRTGIKTVGLHAPDRLERFAELVRADAIAKEREKFFTPEEARIALDDTDFTWHNSVTQDMVDKLMAIRARGNT